MEVFTRFNRNQHALTEDSPILEQIFIYLFILYLILDISLLPKLKQAMVGERRKKDPVLYFFIQLYIFHEWYVKPVRAQSSV